MIHRVEVDIVQPQRSLQHLGLCVWSFRVKALKQHCRFWSRRNSIVNVRLVNTESSKRWSERPISGAVDGIATFMAWGLFLVPIFLAVLPMLPGSAKAICLHHTSYDLVSSGNEPCCLGSLAMVCLSISGFVPPVPHPAPKEEVSSAA